MSNGNLLSVTYVENIFLSLFIGQTEGLHFYVVQSASLSCLVSILDLMFKKKKCPHRPRVIKLFT